MIKVCQGSSIDLNISLTQADPAVPFNLDDAEDIIVLFRYKDGINGTLAKFAKVSASPVLAWTTEDASTGVLNCHVPPSVTAASAAAPVVVEIKVKVNDDYHYVNILSDEIAIVKSLLNDD